MKTLVVKVERRKCTHPRVRNRAFKRVSGLVLRCDVTTTQPPLSHALNTALVAKILIGLMYKLGGVWSGLLELTNKSRLGYKGGRVFKRS